MGTNQPGTNDGDHAGDMWGDALSPEEQAAIEQMEQSTPMPGPDGDEPPANEQRPPKQEARSDDDEPDDDEDDGGEGDKGQDDRPVSRSALLRVKEQSKKYRDELAAERAARAKLEGRFEILAEALGQTGGDGKGKQGDQPANPWDEEDIDPANDIFAAFEQQKRRNAYEKQQREALMAGQTQRDRQTETVSAYVADAERVAAENLKNGEVVTIGEGESARQVPAFQAAYMHVVALRDAQLQAFGIADKAERDRQIAEEERQLVEEAIAAKRSPAETILALAKAGGFKMPEKGATNGTGGKTEKQLQAERHLEQVNAGMRASQSLSGRGGRPAAVTDAKTIAAMGEDEFAAFVAQMGGEEAFARRYLGAGEDDGY